MYLAKIFDADVSGPTADAHDIFNKGVHRQANLCSSLIKVCKLLGINISFGSSICKEKIQFRHVHVKTGQRIFRIGQAFEMLYVVNSGFLKTVVIDENGDEQVLSFPMKSDLLGMDGINTKRYASDAVALSDCDLIVLPFESLTGLGRRHIEMECAMYGFMSRELVREQSMCLLLGSLGAEARVTRFLVSLSDRFGLLGYSSRMFNLRMTRQEIGSYLGITLETVSRTLSALNNFGLISVDQKSIELKDVHALRHFKKLPESMRAKRKQAVNHKSAVSIAYLPPLLHDPGVTSTATYTGA